MITQLHDLETLIRDMMLPRASKGDAVTFPKLVEAICKLSEDTLRKQFVEYLEKMDVIPHFNLVTYCRLF